MLFTHIGINLIPSPSCSVGSWESPRAVHCECRCLDLSLSCCGCWGGGKENTSGGTSAYPDPAFPSWALPSEIIRTLEVRTGGSEGVSSMPQRISCQGLLCCTDVGLSGAVRVIMENCCGINIAVFGSVIVWQPQVLLACQADTNFSSLRLDKLSSSERACSFLPSLPCPL